MRIVDRKGNAVAEGTICLAERKNADGSLTVYFRTDEDIRALIADMQTDGIKGEAVTSDYWLLDQCDRQAGNACRDGTCSSGTCSTVDSGNFTYCRCR